MAENENTSDAALESGCDNNETEAIDSSNESVATPVQPDEEAPVPEPAATPTPEEEPAAPSSEPPTPVTEEPAATPMQPDEEAPAPEPAATPTLEEEPAAPASEPRPEAVPELLPEEVKPDSVTTEEASAENLDNTTLYRNKKGIFHLKKHGILALCPFRSQRTYNTPVVDPVSGQQMQDNKGNILLQVMPYPVSCDSVCPKFHIKKEKGGYEVNLTCGTGVDIYHVTQKDTTLDSDILLNQEEKEIAFATLKKD